MKRLEANATENSCNKHDVESLTHHEEGSREFKTLPDTSFEGQNWKKDERDLQLKLLSEKPSKRIEVSSGQSTNLPARLLPESGSHAEISMLRDLEQVLSGTIDHMRVTGNVTGLNRNGNRHVLRKPLNADAYKDSLHKRQVDGPTLGSLSKADGVGIAELFFTIQDIKKRISDAESKCSSALASQENALNSGVRTAARDAIAHAQNVSDLGQRISRLKTQLNKAEEQLTQSSKEYGNSSLERNRKALSRSEAKKALVNEVLDPEMDDVKRSNDYYVKGALKFELDNLRNLIDRLSLKQDDRGRVEVQAWKEEWQAFTEVKQNIDRLSKDPAVHRARLQYMKRFHQGKLPEKPIGNYHGLDYMHPDQAKISDEEAIELFNMIYAGKKRAFTNEAGEKEEKMVPAFVGNGKEFREYYMRMFLEVKNSSPGNTSFFFMPRDKTMQAHLKILQEMIDYPAHNLAEDGLVMRTFRSIPFTAQRKQRREQMSARATSNDAALAKTTVDGYMSKMLFMGPEYARAKGDSITQVARAIRMDNMALGHWQAGLTRDLTANITAGVLAPTGAVGVARGIVTLGSA